MKLKTSKFGLLVRAAGLSLLLSVAAAAQTGTRLRVDSFPAGVRPVGMDIAFFFNMSNTRIFAATANSGDDSVSIFELSNPSDRWTVASVTVVRGIPAPNGVSFCTSQPNGLPSARFVVTSPTANLITVIQVPQGNILGTVQVGPQPFTAACYLDPVSNREKALVSNAGDNSLMLVDVASLAVSATIPNVPGSRGFRGVVVSANSTSSLVAWAAGTDANVVTVVDLLGMKVLTQIPEQRPTAVRSTGNGSVATMYVASAGDNSIRAYDRDTAQLLTAPQYSYPTVPNPQDFITFAGGLGDFATIGGQDAIWWRDRGGIVSTITGISGAAAVAYNYLRPIPVVLATSTTSNSVFLIYRQPQTPQDFRVSNAASFATGQVAPGSLVSAFAATGVSQNFNATSVPLPKTLGDVTLSVGGSLSSISTSAWKYSSTGAIQASLLFVGPNQVNFQIPPGIHPGGEVAAQLTKPDGTTLLTTLNLTATAPGIFSMSQDGRFQGAVLNDDFSQNGVTQLIAGARPAARGSVIQIYATGGGETTPSLLPGEAAAASGNPLVLTNAQPTVMIGGQQATVVFSGMAPGYVGLWQINAQIPPFVTSGNAVPLVVAAGGATSNTVTIAVQ